MIGKHRDGGYAEFIVMPARNVFRLPDEVPFSQAAILMCSSATSLHALNKARLRPGETVAVFGIGGLGLSAIQLARAFGAQEVYAVDIRQSKLDLARNVGAISALVNSGARVKGPANKCWAAWVRSSTLSRMPVNQGFSDRS